MTTTILIGDCRAEMAKLEPESVDLVATDPPYGQTNLTWDQWPTGWLAAARRVLKPSGSMWVFGNVRMFMDHAAEFKDFAQAQDLVWEKHNGTNAFSDRFRRVHEQAVQFYRRDSGWAGVYKSPLFTSDASARTVRRKARPPQWGTINASSYSSADGGPRLMRSVMFCRSEHGRAEHPTQKPIACILPLIEYSCPLDGIVLDPFAGSGTTGLACRLRNRAAILIEADEEYASLIERRIRNDAPLFAQNNTGDYHAGTDGAGDDTG